jgi:hypothetical protein
MNLKKHKKLFTPRLTHRRKKPNLTKKRLVPTCICLSLKGRVVGESNAIICEGTNPFPLEKKLSQ